jgi:tetratricopeptide (TPR) repeat protein
MAASCRTATSGGYRVDVRGVYSRPITSRLDAAAKKCSEGLLLCYGFNHAEATRRFERAIEIDPSCAMAHFGIAFAAGPNINDTELDRARYARATAEVRAAKSLAGPCTPVEKALIDALSFRYADPPPDDRKSLNAAFAMAMRNVYKQFPDDPDVGAIFADSLMNLRPWDLWSRTGEPRPDTLEIVATLEHVLATNPDHPGANHYLIHACEASPDPGRALAAADRLRTLVPELGHLVHMPSHIDIRLGHYEKAIEANLRGIAADSAYIDVAGAGGFYAVYRAHNYHFLVYAAMFEGQSALALRYAREMLTSIPQEVAKEMPEIMDAFRATPYHVMERFGLWNEILAERCPPEIFKFSIAFWHFARALAWTALGHLDEATSEAGAFEIAAASVPEGRMFGNNKAAAILAVGREYLAGELEFRRGNADSGFQHLREAVRLDDDLAYDEPWGWMVPARHALGALLLEAGRVAEAKEVYEADLKRHPENGWALHGLAECHQRLGNANLAAETRSRYRRAWTRADIDLTASCFCRKQ